MIECRESKSGEGYHTFSPPILNRQFIVDWQVFYSQREKPAMVDETDPTKSDQSPSIVVRLVGEERDLPPSVRRIDTRPVTTATSERIPPLADSALQEHRQDRR